jgi:hypothetical protein
MFFDQVAGVCERHLPDLVPTLSKAKIFCLESRHFKSEANEERSVPNAVSRWEPDANTIENFKLPFPVVAIEIAGDNRCFVLKTISEKDRLFEFIIASRTPLLCDLEIRREPEDGYLVATGRMVALPDSVDSLTSRREASVLGVRAWEGGKKTGMAERKHGTVSHELSLVGLARGTPEIQPGLTKREYREQWEEMAQASVASTFDLIRISCALAVHAVLVINEPSQFIVEEGPESVRGETKKKIQRSNSAPRFILLNPRQIRQRFNHPAEPPTPSDEGEETTKCKRASHERRGHYRRLQAEQFKNKRGQVIWIKPVWVGPSEATVNGKRYKVRLDL